MIKVKDLTFSYGENKTILENVNLEIRKNEFVVLEGNSGIGKSTFLSCLAGFIHPTKGQILINGQDIALEENSKKIRKEMGYLPQENCLISSLTLSENVLLPQFFEKKSENWEKEEQKARLLIEKVSLTGKEHHKPSELSGGEQRRAEIARLLMIENSIVLMDEPTSGMDEACVDILNSLLKELKENNITIIVSTHDERMITNQVDTVYKIQNGQIYEKK